MDHTEQIETALENYLDDLENYPDILTTTDNTPTVHITGWAHRKYYKHIESELDRYIDDLENAPHLIAYNSGLYNGLLRQYAKERRLSISLSVDPFRINKPRLETAEYMIAIDPDDAYGRIVFFRRQYEYLRQRTAMILPHGKASTGELTARTRTPRPLRKNPYGKRTRRNRHPRHSRERTTP